MDKFLKEIAQKCNNQAWLKQFITSYTNTLDKTVKILPDKTVHVITGDIPAMWLRDSTAQLRPYLFVAQQNKDVLSMLVGLVKRQFFYLDIDIYANAFNIEPSGDCWEKDYENQNPWVWERKFEIDSLCYPIQLAYLIWKNTGCTEQFDENFKKGVANIINLFKTEQYHEEKSEYRFIRKNSYFTDTLSRDGKGALVKSGIGLIWSGFRPSDDASTYGYHIPSNMFAVIVLNYVYEIAKDILNDILLADEAKKLADEVYNAIEKYGKTKTEEFGDVYAYEVDGFGMFNLMDDANVPSLLSMEYLGYKGDKKTMENTRKFILSEANPYYYTGKYASGVGSPHTPSNYIWHIALAVQGLTAKTIEEKEQILQTLVNTTANTGMMHEGFDVNNPSKFTREWFSWANAMYSELFLDVMGYKIKI